MPVAKRRVETSLALLLGIPILAGFLERDASRTTRFGTVALGGVRPAFTTALVGEHSLSHASPDMSDTLQRRVGESPYWQGR